MRQMLAEAVAPTVEALLGEPKDLHTRADELTMEEFDVLCDELDRMPPVPQLPDDAFTREGIYQDHP